jgi:phage head maturation protease
VAWWNTNVEACENSNVKSTVLWNHFKKHLESGNIANALEANGFKDVLCSFLHESKIVKPKTKTGALEIVGYKIKM